MKTRLIYVEAEKPYFLPQWLATSYWQEFTRLEETAKVVQFPTRAEARAFLRSDPEPFGVAPHYRILTEDEITEIDNEIAPAARIIALLEEAIDSMLDKETDVGVSKQNTGSASRTL